MLKQRLCLDAQRKEVGIVSRAQLKKFARSSAVRRFWLPRLRTQIHNIILHYYEIQQLKHEHPVAQDETLNRTRNENPLREARQLHRPLSFSPRRPSLFNRFLERKRECTSNDISPPWFTRLLPPCVTCESGYKYVRPLPPSTMIAELSSLF